MSTPERPYALVTGASRGLGKLFAQALAKRGHPLLLVARDHNALEQLRSDLVAAHNVDVRCLPADLSQAQGVDALLAACEPFAVDYVVNNAGFGLGGPFAAHKVDEIRAMLRLNIEATSVIAHHFLPQLCHHRGVLLQLASQAAFQPIPYMAAYAASKAYVLHLTEALQREVKDQGVRVVAVCPAATKTEFFTQAGIRVEDTRFKLAEPQSVVDAALHAVARNQPVVSPGWQNKLASWSSRLLSRQMAVRVAEAAVWRD